jgi:hypothetical protein
MLEPCSGGYVPRAIRTDRDQFYQSIIHALHAPVAEAVTQAVHTAYSDLLAGLPYPELPVICVAGK